MNKRALVTGALGFTGRYMSEGLRRSGYEVFGTSFQKIESSNYFQADLCDIKSLMCLLEHVRPDVVVHLAAFAFINHRDADEIYKVNLIGTRNILECLSKCSYKPSKILIASSANVYGNQTEKLITELSSVAPTNDYAVSKLAMEFLAKTYMDHLPILIVRPFNYTGTGQNQNFLIPKIISNFCQKSPYIELGNIDVSRDFNDVRSVIEAYIGLIEVGVIGETYNIASGISYSLREIIGICTEISGHEIEIVVNPAFVRKNEVKSLCGDATKLKELLSNWKPIKLNKTLAWMLSDSVY